MQEYYRSLDGVCYGGGLSCHGRQEVTHHHFFWGKSTALRFEEKNLVPLCSACHMAFHKGSHRVKTNYEREMQEVWGLDWEDQLLLLEQKHVPMTEAEKRDYLQRLIKTYNNQTES